MILSFAFLAASDWCVLLEVVADSSPPFWVTPPVTTQAELAWLPFWCFVADSCLLRTHRSLLLIPDSCSGPLSTNPDPGSALPLLVSSTLPLLYALAVICVLAICCPMCIYVFRYHAYHALFYKLPAWFRLLVGWVTRLLSDTQWRSSSRPLMAVCTSTWRETVLGQVARGFTGDREGDTLGLRDCPWKDVYCRENLGTKNLTPRSEQSVDYGSSDDEALSCLTPCHNSMFRAWRVVQERLTKNIRVKLCAGCVWC